MAIVPYIQYGLAPYGLYPYGRYDLTTDSYKLIEQPRMRIRLRLANGGIGVWVENQVLEQKIPGHIPPIRIRTNAGDWMYTQHISLPKHASKVRVRMRSANTIHPWILYEEAKIEQEGKE